MQEASAQPGGDEELEVEEKTAHTQRILYTNCYLFFHQAQRLVRTLR